MSELSLEPYWERVEAHFQRAALAVAEGDAEALTEHCDAMQQLAVDLVGYMGQGGALGSVAPALRQRMHKLMALMPTLRESLHRREAFTNQALQVLVPTEPASTYGGDYLKVGAVKYGSLARQSGNLRTVAA